MGFNIRAYGILLRDRKVLIAEEHRMDLQFFKFPGGGLEEGEGLSDCLKRECMEELGHEIVILSHYYTTDFFQQSAFNPNDQIISIYYLIDFSGKEIAIDSLKSPEPEIVLHWMPIEKLVASEFMFPIDQKVVRALRGEKFESQK